MSRTEAIPVGAETLPQAVAHHARVTPGAPAVTGRGEHVDYAALHAMADRVAATVAAHAPVRGECVLLHGEPTAWGVAAALGIMRAGAAVVPLGERDPAARVRLVVEDCGARLALSTRPSGFPAADAVEHLLELSEASLPHPSEHPGAGPAADDLAYVLFTSGSTGRPKGVMIEHRNLMHYVRAVADRYRVDGEVPPLPALTPLSFDASVLQVYAPLARGADVWLAPASAREDPAQLLTLLASRPGAALHCVPSLWAEVLRELGPAGAGGSHRVPRAVLLGGEVVPPDLWEETRRALPDTLRANVYGPTEATVQATGEWHHDDPPRPAGLPPHTGTPLPGVGIFVRAADGTRLGPGERGEIHISGPGVGRGYLGRPDLTVAHFTDEPGVGRVYRTGDEGMLDAAGRLTVLGRLDDQCKVRGYRVEPGETEAALREAPGVSAAAVTVLAPRTSEARLVAAVTLTDGRTDGAGLEAALRDHCAQRLAPYLVPARIRVLPALPRTANGKTDRAAVRDLFAAAPPTPAPAGTGGSERERLRAVWCRLLQVPQVADTDDFFDLGGHSLLATRLIGRTRKELGRPVPLPTIFTSRTFDAFARAVRADEDAAPDTGGSPSAPVPVPDDTPVPLALEQRSLWALHRAAPELPSAHVVLPLELHGPVSRDTVVHALRTLVRDHPALRCVVDGDDEDPVLRLLPDAEVPLTEADLRAAPDPERRLREHARTLYLRPFRLADAIPVRAAWLRAADDRSVLLLCVHHIACDGLSLEILTADLRDLLAGTAPARPAGPRLGHREYAAWQRRRWEAGELAPALAHWTAHLELGREEIAWPCPPVPPADRVYGARTIALPAPPGLAAAVQELSVRRGATAFAVLAAALGAALHTTTGVKELSLGMLAAGRPRAEFEAAVGLFATTLALRLPLRERHPGQLIAAAAKAVLDAQIHQDVPLETAAEHVRPEAAARHPFDVGLSVDWTAAPAGSAAAGAVRVRRLAPDAEDLPTGIGAASCPLTVAVRRDGDDLAITAEYMTDLLDEPTVRQVVEGQVRVLLQWTGAPR
ncbi:amino acid adenylation domain-containing protein [Streptomyces sp. NPDC049687]|uniref:amino acid adenylation domain-containing protein n=1 Tax=Streptomyces sp. NPDC049687 TaxID=3365596 RepID=UPI0037B6F51F